MHNSNEEAMKLCGNGFVSVMNAQEIANIIQAFYSSTVDASHFKLEYTDDREVERHEVWVRPILDKQVITRDDMDQTVRCETNDGKLVDIIVPRKHREYQPATVVIVT